MHSLRQLRIGARLAVGFGLVLLLLSALGVFGIYQMKQANFYAHDLGTNWLPSVRVLANVRNTLNVGRRASTRLILETDAKGKQAQVDRFKDAMEVQMDKLMHEYEPMIATPEEKRLYESWRAQLSDYVAMERKVAELSATDDSKMQEARVAELGEVSKAFSKLLDTVGQSIAINVEGGNRSTAAAEASYQQSLYVFSSVIALSLALGVVLALVVTRSITAPLQTAVGVAEAVAQGDLTTRFDISGRDEAAALLRALQHMNERLVDIVSQVRLSSDSIATGSAEIAMGNADLSQRTETQASNLEETAASMEELSSTVKTNADTAQQANRLATEATEAAEKGGSVVGNVVATMQDISASSRKISDIIGVIDGIAFQTNILALNAAVEAARAGEQGRGFAVVASEVRSLAQRSADAAKEIKTLINTSVEKVESGTQLVDEAGASMDNIVNQVKRVGALISEITSSSMEQSSGISQIGDAVNQLDQVTQQNAALVEESAAAAASLQTQSQQLAELVAVFKINGQNPTLLKPARSAPAPTPARAPASGGPALKAPSAPKPAAAAKPLGPGAGTKALASRPTTTTKASRSDDESGDWESF